MNTIGTIFRLTDFGESHGEAIGGVIDGMPAGITFDRVLLDAEMARRRPGTSALTTARKEPDTVEVLSGIFEGVTTGTPIGFIIRNTNQHSSDYENLRHTLRPSHADFTYGAKYGVRDHRGGGRSSARETAVRVAAGAFAKMALNTLGITIAAVADSIGDVKRKAGETDPITPAMAEAVAAAKSKGDTLGGVISCRIDGCPAGLGEPVFGKLHARLGAAMLSINACHGFEYGSGFEGSTRKGSESLDTWVPDATDPRGIHAAHNYSGGIQGGISNGEPITMRVAFKPIATLLQPIDTVTDNGEATTLQARGRHDPCVIPRALVIVEAMAAITILDAVLLHQTTRLR